MATGVDPSIKSVENLDDLLKCNICLETLKEPKLLACLHTFCKLCIHTYVDSFKEKDKIACPICRQIVSSENPDDVDDFVNKLSENNFIDSLLNKSSMVNSEKLCDSCKVRGKDIKAVSFCVICEEAFCKPCHECHKSFKVSADHEIIQITDIAKNREGANISKVIFCDDHKKSPVQVYCVDHKKACCTLCATLSHRKCEKVISIEEASEGIKQKPQVLDLLKQIDENIQLLADVIDCREENEANIERETTSIETMVTRRIKEMKDHLDKLQNKILSELNATKKEASLKVADDTNDFTSYKSAITQWQRMLAGVLKHGSEQQTLTIVNEISPKMKNLQAEIRDALKNIRNNFIWFQGSKDIEEFERTVQSFGIIKMKELRLKIEKSNIKIFNCNFRSGEIKVIKSIHLAPSGHTSGIFLDDLVIFTSNNSKKILKYDQNGDLLGNMLIPTSPTDLSHVTESRVVVCSWSPSVLYIIESKDMKLLEKLQLLETCSWGVCVFGTTQFLVGTDNQLTWIDQTSGTKVKSEKTSGESWFVSASGNNSYIFGDGKNSVSYVVNDSKKINYTDNQLSCPRGIGIDDEGNFYITGLNSRIIHQISNKLDLIRIIPAESVDIESPWILRFNPGTNRFLVTCLNSGKATLCEIE